MTLDYLKEGGVPQGPFGSLIRDKYGIDNSDPDKIFSAEGLAALRLALSEYREAGATFSGAPTFRLTDFRAGNRDEAWEYDPASKLHLTEVTRARNETAVEIARGIYGDRIVGLIAPLSDTSGKHDERWKDLDDKKVDWAMQRQRPQIEVLRNAGVNVIWGEAFRYRDEAIAVARLAKELKAEALIICFEANDNGVPDPTNGGSYTFMDMKRDLQTEAGSSVEVFVGANCTGIKNIKKVWERGDLIDVAYPNSLNFGDHEKSEFADLVERHERTPVQNARIARMVADHATNLQTFVSFWREAFRERGVLIAGGCCGTTPEHTWVARQAFNEARRKT